MSMSNVFSQSYLELRKCLLPWKYSDWNLIRNCWCFVNTVFPGNNSLYLSGHHPWSLPLMMFDAGAEHNIGFVPRIKEFLALCHLLNYGVVPSFDIVPQQVSLHFKLQWKWKMWANAVFFITHLDIFRQKIKTDFWCLSVLKVLSKIFERWMAFHCRRSRALLHTSCQPGIVQRVSLCRKVFVSVCPLTLWRRPSIVEPDSCQKSVGGEDDSEVLLTEKRFEKPYYVVLWLWKSCCDTDGVTSLLTYLAAAIVYNSWWLPHPNGALMFLSCFFHHLILWGCWLVMATADG